MEQLDLNFQTKEFPVMDLEPPSLQQVELLNDFLLVSNLETCLKKKERKKKF